MELPAIFPFSRLQLAVGEAVIWVGSNPTFHRFFEYGLVISNVALYLCGPAWLFAWWRRYPLSEMRDVQLSSDGSRPGLRFYVGRKKVSFYTPFDFYSDEMDFDRKVLAKAFLFLESEAHVREVSQAS
jgi:hypothetical protein